MPRRTDILSADKMQQIRETAAERLKETRTDGPAAVLPTPRTSAAVKTEVPAAAR